MNQKELKETESFVEDLAKDVGEFLLDSKSKIDILTNIDVQAEEIIIKAIENKFPSHSIFSEEKGIVEKGSQYKWVIDPLDGTKNYVRDIPIFNTAIGLMDKDEIVLGVSYRPIEDHLYSASLGNGFFFNGKRSKVSDNNNLGKSFVYVNLPNYKMERSFYESSFNKIADLTYSCYRVRSFADSIMGMSFVARGVFDAFLVFQFQNLWDVLPGMIFVKEAGGKITNTKGGPIEKNDLNQGLLLTNGLVHERILKIIGNI